MTRFNNFESVLRKFLASIGYEVLSDDKRAVYDRMNNLKSEKKRGIWKFVATQLGIDEKDVHNYYHGKWVMQFFEDARGYRQELLSLTRNACATCTDVCTQDIVKQFEISHPNASFFPRQVQQIIGVYKSRLLNKSHKASLSENQFHAAIPSGDSSDNSITAKSDQQEAPAQEPQDTFYSPFMNMIAFDELLE